MSDEQKLAGGKEASERHGVFRKKNQSLPLQRIRREHDAFQELKVRNMIGKVKQQQRLYLKGQLDSNERHRGKSIDFHLF